MFPVRNKENIKREKKKLKDEIREEKECRRRAVLAGESKVVFVRNEQSQNHLPSKIIQELEKCFAVIAEDYYGTNTVNAMRHIRHLVSCSSRELSLFTCTYLYKFFTDVEDSELVDIILAAFSSWPKPSRFPLNEIQLAYKMLVHHCAGNSRKAFSILLSIIENYRFGPFFMLNVWKDGRFLSRELDAKLLKKCLTVCKGEAHQAYDQPLIKYLVWCDRFEDVDENARLFSITMHHYPEDLLTSPWVLYCRSSAEKERLAVAITILLCGGSSHLPSAILENLDCLFDCDIKVSSLCIHALLVCVQLDVVPLQSYLPIFLRALREGRVGKEATGLMYFILLSAKYEKHRIHEISHKHVSLDEVIELIETKAPELHTTEGFTAPNDAFLQFLCSTHPRLARAGEQLLLLAAFNENPNNLITWLNNIAHRTRLSVGKRCRRWIMPVLSYYLICSRYLNVQEKCWMVFQNIYVPSSFEYFIELTRRVHCVELRCRMVFFLYKENVLMRDETGLRFEGHKSLKNLKTFMTVIDDSDVAHLFPTIEVQNYLDFPLILLCLVKLKPIVKTFNYTMKVQLIAQLERLIDQSIHDARLLPLCLLAIELLMDLCERETSRNIFERIWHVILHSFENIDDRFFCVWICKFFGKVPAMKTGRTYAGYCSARILWFTAVSYQDSLVTEAALRALRNFNLRYFDSTFLIGPAENKKKLLNSCKVLSNDNDFANYVITLRMPLSDCEWLELLSRKPSEGMFELFADLCVESRYSDEFYSFDSGLQLILNHDIHSTPLTDFISKHGLPSTINYEFYINCFKLYRTIIVISSSLLERKNCIVSILQRSSGELKKAIEKVVLPFYTMKVDVLGIEYRRLKTNTSDLIKRGFDMDHSVFLEELQFILNPKLSRPDFDLLIKLLRTAVIDTFYREKGDSRRCIGTLMGVLNDEGISIFFRRAIYHMVLLVWMEEPFCKGSVLLCQLLSTLNPNLLLEEFNIPNRASMVSTLKYMKLVEYAAIRWQSLKMIMLCLEVAKDDPRYQDAALLTLFRFYQSLTLLVKNQRDFGKIYSLMTSCPNNFTYNVFIMSAYKFSGIWDVSSAQTLLHGIQSFPIALPIIVFRVWQYIAHTVRRDLIAFAKNGHTDPVIKHAFYAGARALETAIMIEKHSTTKTVCF